MKLLAAVAAAGVVVTTAAVAVLQGGTAAWQGSFNASYQAASPGDTITVPAGTYGTQVVSAKASARGGTCSVSDTSQCVRFVMGGAVKINGNLEVHGSGILIDGGGQLDISNYADTEADSTSSFPDHVVFQNGKSASFGVFSSKQVTFKDWQVGPNTVSTGCGALENKIGYGGGIAVVPTDILLDGVRVHDQNGDQGRIASDCHFGGLFLVTADGLTVKNSVFERNVVYHVQVQNFGGAPPARRVLFQNNSFSCTVDWLYNGAGCIGQRAIQFDYDPGTEFTLKDNVAANGANGLYGCYVGTCGNLAGLVTSGNVNLATNTTAPPLLGTTPPPPTTTETTPPPTTPPPPSCVAPTLGWKLPTDQTITLTWPTVPGATAYRLYKAGALVSTAGSGATSAKFGSLPYGSTTLGVAAVCPTGEKLATLTTVETRTAG